MQEVRFVLTNTGSEFNNEAKATIICFASWVCPDPSILASWLFSPDVISYRFSKSASGGSVT